MCLDTIGYSALKRVQTLAISNLVETADEVALLSVVPAELFSRRQHRGQVSNSDT